MTNKFDILWQIMRTKAKVIKDPQKKIDYIMSFLMNFPNAHNKDRVKNWLKMTSVAYSDLLVRSHFNTALNSIEENPEMFRSVNDNETKMEDISNEDLMDVYNDLKKRKYGFQFKKVPVAHTEFMKQLEKEINKRNMKLSKFNTLYEEILKGGKADGMSVQDIADKWKVFVDEVEKQIAIGMKVEREHTTDEDAQKKITKDHLAEDLYYYKKLKTLGL